MAEPSCVTVELRDGYAILSMHKEPVNSMDLAMWQALDKALQNLEANPQVHGLIITSGLRKDVFTAGNDLLELYAPRTSESRHSNFWMTSNKFLCRLMRTRLSTVAAIRGFCPAAGCAVAMCCDHRIMTTNGNIGLNEVQLGIPVPKYWALLMQRLIGHKAADKLLLTGKLVSPTEAKALGLIDQIVESNQLLGVAEKVMQQLVKLPTGAVAATKLLLREDFSKEWESYCVIETPGAWQLLNKPEPISKLASILQRLSRNKGSDNSSNSSSGQPTSKL